jgi:hypothetical protein
MSIPMTPAEVILRQSEVIAGLTKIQTINQALVQRVLDALRIFMMDLQAAGVSIQAEAAAVVAPEPVAPPPRDPNVLNFKRPPEPEAS